MCEASLKDCKYFTGEYTYIVPVVISSEIRFFQNFLDIIIFFGILTDMRYSSVILSSPIL